MRIAFIVNRFPRLSETFILNMITGLIDQGHQVDIFSTGLSHESKCHPDITAYQLLSQTYYRPTIPSHPLKQLFKGSLLLGAEIYRNPETLWQALSIYTQSGSELFFSSLPFLNRDPYDIIHCHFGPLGQLAIKLRNLGIISGPIITSFHGYDITSYLQEKGNSTYSHLFEQGDLFLPISHHWKCKLVSLGCSPERIVVHHMGINCSQFSFNSRQWDPSGPVRLVSCCRLVEKKGIQYAIQAVAKAIKTYNSIHYQIIGDGPLKPELKTLIQALNLSEHVELSGWQDQSEIIRSLNKAHIFLAPSVTSLSGDQEGIPVAIMEAMAHGLPILSTQHSGIPELVEHGQSGYLAAERDTDQLAYYLIQLLQDPHRWVPMGLSGRAQVEANFNIQDLTKQLISYYERCCSHSSLTSYCHS